MCIGVSYENFNDYGNTTKREYKSNNRIILNEFKDEKNEFDEIVLPNDFHEICYGCANCILKGEDKCPHFSLVNPMMEKLV